MGKREKLAQKILSGRQDRNINFQEAVNLLLSFGFSQRVKGSHHIFFRENVEEIINLQPNGTEAKPYQVRQIRELMLKYQLGEQSE
ncbi:MAG: type II toxin-antitoxin system HicA family toxin [Treponematales bacterium]|jgi:predicted RNA binding protein YcfA (HicA-like mRNA interferase family)